MKWGIIASCLGIAIPALAAPAALVWATPACADSWMLPETTTYFSADKTCRLTVVPRDLNSQLDFFEDKIAGKEKAGQREQGAGAPRATLERRDSDGKWTGIWSRALVNDVAPVSALISGDGHYVVTLDNWHSIGWGDDAIVIYDVRQGSERRFSVEKLLGKSYFRALPHSVSSVRWSETERIEGGQLLLDIVVPQESSERALATVTIAIDLATGAPSERNALAWRDARNAADRVNAAAIRHEEERRAARKAPLLGPQPQDVRGWHDYLKRPFCVSIPIGSTIIRARQYCCREVRPIIGIRSAGCVKRWRKKRSTARCLLAPMKRICSPYWIGRLPGGGRARSALHASTSPHPPRRTLG